MNRDWLSRFSNLSTYVKSQSTKGRWLVLTHDNPDPDALASALLVARVLHRGLRERVTIAYGGIIGRAENQAMVSALGLKISHIKHVNLRSYRRFALVDTQPGTGNNQLPPGITPDIVMDHHPLRRASQSVPFCDIRPDYGATATLAAEYYLASGIELTSSVATALVYAIRTETREFSREAGGPDRKIYDLVLPRVNKRALAKIQYPRLPLSYFATVQEALARLWTVETLVISHLGCVDQPDIVPEIADLLVRMEGKTWSLCSGVFEDRIFLSLRTTNPRANAGQIMQRLVGRKGRGGGHGMLAGGWVPLSQDPEKQQERLGVRLAKYLRKDPAKLKWVPLGGLKVENTDEG